MIVDRFEKQMKRFMKELIPSQALLFQRRIAYELFRRFILRTPRDRGDARNGWQMTVGYAPSAKKINKNNLTDGEKAIATVRVNQDIWITNNVPYINVLDQGLFRPKNPGPSSDKRSGRKGRVLVKNGFSIQAPRGIIKPTLEEVLTIFR